MNNNKPLIYLYNSIGLGLILRLGTGVLYSNQAGGHSCQYPEIEGAYIPLDNQSFLENEMIDFFTGPKWNGWCCKKIDKETADFIDDLLLKSPVTKIFKVDRSMLEESFEAWIYVNIITIEKEDSSLFSHVKSNRGILTWENSD